MCKASHPISARFLRFRFGVEEHRGDLHCGDNDCWYQSQGYHVEDEAGDKPHCRTGYERDKLAEASEEHIDLHEPVIAARPFAQEKRSNFNHVIECAQ